MSKLKPENPAKINALNIGRFLKGYARKFSAAFGLLEYWKQEQVIWRTRLAKQCTDNKACLYCGCDTPAKYYGDEACEDPVKQCYPAMMNEKEWNTFKRKTNLKIEIDNDTD